MADIHIDIPTGQIRAAHRNAERFLSRKEREVEDIIEQTADLVFEQLKENAPVDTGYLRSTIRKEVERMAAAVSVGAEYSPYPEFGTASQAEQRYFRDAIDTGEAYMRRQMQRL